MNTFTINFFDIDYSGNDFCGEIEASIATQIINSQPKEVEITFTLTDTEVKEWNDRVALGESDDWLVDEIAFDFWPEHILSPTSYSYSFIN